MSISRDRGGRTVHGPAPRVELDDQDHIEQSPVAVMGAPLALIRDFDGNMYELAEIPS